MIYYVIYLKNGYVVDIDSFDTNDAQMKQYYSALARITQFSGLTNYDAVQFCDVIA